VKGFYGWLYRRGVLLADPSVALTLPKVRRTTVACDYLSQQEVAAMLQTQAQTVVGRQEGSQGWAIEHRNLALLCLAIATGRRRASLVSLKVKDVDFERNEVRVAYEKGKPGRVLPCADWAAQVVLQYVQQARPLLLGKRNDEGFLFVALARAHVCDWYPGRLLKRLQQRTALHNPDLTGLADKSLSAHSLRTTFATLLFFNGANIRTVNELLLHTSLSTTAKYTPLGVDDLRRTFRLAHPRA
jgi:site-specific recombinase XerD